jgi:hypothetical protein
MDPTFTFLGGLTAASIFLLILLKFMGASVKPGKIKK